MNSLFGGISRFVSRRSNSTEPTQSETASTPSLHVENPESALVIHGKQRRIVLPSPKEPHMRDPPSVIHLGCEQAFSTPPTSIPDREAEGSQANDEPPPLPVDEGRNILLSDTESDSSPVQPKRSSKRKAEFVPRASEKSKRLRSHKGKGVAETTSAQDFDLKRFISFDAQQRYALFSLGKNRFIKEKETVFGDEDGLKGIIEEAGLMRTVTEIGSFDPDVVWEFWANFPKVKPETGVYEVLVRDWVYEFSAAKVNQLFSLQDVDVRTHKKNVAGILDEDLARFLTKGSIDDLGKVTYSTFSADNKTLYKMCCNNWLPSSNDVYMHPLRGKIIYMINHKIPFNFGILVCEHVSQLAWSTQAKLKLPFPNLIYKLLMTQHPVPDTTTANIRGKTTKQSSHAGQLAVKNKPVTKKGAMTAAAKERERRAMRLAIQVLQNALDAGGDVSGSDEEEE